MPVESVRIMCPSLTCRKVLAVPSSSRGKNVRCRNCGSIIRVPEKPNAQGTSKPAPSVGPADAAANPGNANKAA